MPLGAGGGITPFSDLIGLRWLHITPVPRFGGGAFSKICAKKRKEYDEHREQLFPSYFPSSLPIIFGSFFQHFNPFAPFSELDHQQFDQLFNRKFRNSDSTTTGPRHGRVVDPRIDNVGVFVQSSQYQRGPDGRVTTQERVRTTQNGETKDYHYRQVKDKNGKIIERSGEPIPRENLNNWLPAPLNSNPNPNPKPHHRALPPPEFSASDSHQHRHQHHHHDHHPVRHRSRED